MLAKQVHASSPPGPGIPYYRIDNAALTRKVLGRHSRNCGRHVAKRSTAVCQLDTLNHEIHSLNRAILVLDDLPRAATMSSASSIFQQPPRINISSHDSQQRNGEPSFTQEKKKKKERKDFENESIE